MQACGRVFFLYTSIVGGQEEVQVLKWRKGSVGHNDRGPGGSVSPGDDIPSEAEGSSELHRIGCTTRASGTDEIGDVRTHDYRVLSNERRKPCTG